jgi:hypothetical protein
MQKEKLVNPFIRNSGIKVAPARVSTKNVNLEDIPRFGEISANVNVRSELAKFPVDRVVPAKAYMDENSFSLFMGLSPAGRKLLDVILFKVVKNTDRVKIGALNSSEIMGCSVRTFYSAVTDLVESGFIVKYKGSEYWINPHLVFKGNRTATYKDYLDYEYKKK